MLKRWFAALTAALLLCAAGAQAQEAQAARLWREQFAAALAALPVLNDPMTTADPARAGQMLIEYEFGTVLAASADCPQAQEIAEIDVRTAQVTDWRGVRVGMTLEEALSGVPMPQTHGASLAVLDIQSSGWSWAYLGEGGVYGVEFIAYDLAEPVTEYTLTYVVGEDGRIAAIRVKAAPSTQAQAQAGVQTAMEIAGRQQGEALTQANASAMFAQSDLTILGRAALYTPVYELVSLLGEPVEVQTLPAGAGRILLYEGAAVQLGLDEQTGVEIVRALTATDAGLIGPRGVQLGMGVQEAAALFRCDGEVYAPGGVLYLEGEAYGEAPFGELRTLAGGQMQLRYCCQTAAGETAWLVIGMEDGAVASWRLFTGEAEE